MVPNGTAITIAIAATNTVPVRSPSTPMRGGLTSVRHSSRVRKSTIPVSEIAGRLRRKRKIPTSVSRTSTVSPAPRVTRLNHRSTRLGTSVTMRGVRCTRLRARRRGGRGHGISGCALANETIWLNSPTTFPAYVGSVAQFPPPIRFHSGALPFRKKVS